MKNNDDIRQRRQRRRARRAVRTAREYLADPNSKLGRLMAAYKEMSDAGTLDWAFLEK